MRLQHTLVSLLFAFSCAERLNGRHGLRIRQENNDAATTTSDLRSTTTATNDETPTITESASRTSSSEEAQTSSESDRGDVTSPITTTGEPTATPTVIETPVPTATNAPDENPLPIEPRITPALGVGGVILMIAGIGLGFVGIKHRATQTFLSTALVVALGCEVLVIYLMNPPVSDAVQGAFLIAGVLGGCLLGGLALIFQEVSEGFGCILGGFCFAMWLLVLVPGGTIKNQAGRIILLSVFCAACFCLYVSRYTRIYGIIICTSFAGATTFILGIDCFAKAGLKEFWMYIWSEWKIDIYRICFETDNFTDLNEDVFPLFTDTYPITKNMRAEIAGIVIIAFFGTMSQIKIWSIVKETKSKRDAERLAYEEAREAEEAELGRGIEERNKHDRAQWEGTYDDKKMPQTNVESTVSIDAYGNAVSELDLTNNTKYGDRRVSYPLVQLRPATSDEHGPVALRRMPSANSLAVSENRRASAVSSNPPGEFGEEGGRPSQSSARLQSPSSTSLNNPDLPAHGGQESIALRSSVAWPSEQYDGQNGKNRYSVGTRRLSSMSLAAKEALEANDELYEPVEEDLASSVAATAAEPPDADALSVVISRPASMFLSPATGSPLPVNENEQFIEEDDEALNLRPKSMLSTSTPKSPGAGAGASYFDITPATQDTPVQTSLSEKLPLRMSKAALNHRTNEWAKEVGRAEPEPIEEVEDHTTDAVQIESSNAADAARAEQNNAAPPPPPPPAAPKVVPAAVPERRRSESTNPYRQSKHLSRTPSNPALTQSHMDNEESWNAPLGKRRSSNPLASIPTTSMSPTNEHVAPYRSGSAAKMRTLSAMSSMPNLLDERRDMIGRKITTTSFMVPTISEDAPVQGTSESSRDDHASLSEHTKPSTNTSIGEEDDDEDMTLAQRKALVQQQQQEQQQQNFGYTNFEPAGRSLSRQTSQAFQPHTMSRQGSQMFQQHSLSRQASHQMLQSQAEPNSPPRALRMSGGMVDTHQPRRMSSHNFNKQAMNWSAWRSSTALDVMQQDPAITHNSQMDMLRAARAQADAEAKQRQLEQQARQAQMDAHMRMGGMNDAHRAAMARMQGKANAHAQ